VNLASISYDSQEILRRFANAYRLTYPLLSDVGSVVIKKFGILNPNVPPDVAPFYGMPFPGQYLIGPNGIVREKFFLPDYQTRVSASHVLLKNHGGSVGENATTTQAEELRVTLRLSDTRSFAGQQLGFDVEFALKPGWHIYGGPLPENYRETSLKFDQELVANQSLDFHKPTPVEFEALGETLPVYEGTFKAVGQLLLKRQIKPGEHKLRATLLFQLCSRDTCKIPQSVCFELPIRIDAYVPGAKATAQ